MAHTPQSNVLVKNINGQLRSVLKPVATRTIAFADGLSQACYDFDSVSKFMTTHLYIKLNDLFSNDNKIHDIKTYLENNVLPPTLDSNNKKIKHFLTKPNKFKEVENTKLYYEDPEHKLEVIPRVDKQDTLKRLYDDQYFSVGSGQNSLYFKLRDKYLNIKRNDVADFLK